MDFELTSEQEAFRETARRSAQDAVESLGGLRDPTRAPLSEVLQQLAPLQIMGLTVPHGDEGGDHVRWVLALMEIAKVCPSIGHILFVHSNLFCFAVRTFGNPDQKKTYLQPFASGGRVGSFALSKGEWFSGPWETTAVPSDKGEGWILNGTAAHVPYLRFSSCFILPAVTGPLNGGGEVSFFLLERKVMPEFRWEPEGHEPVCLEKGDMAIEGVKVPQDALLGEQGEGARYLEEMRPRVWVGLAALALGSGRAALERALEWAKVGDPSGRIASLSQSVQWKLADMAMELDAAELLTLRAAWRDDQRKPFEKEAAMAKMAASEAALKASMERIRITGGGGDLREESFLQRMCGSEMTWISQGSSEGMRKVVVGHLAKGIKGSM